MRILPILVRTFRCKLSKPVGNKNKKDENELQYGKKILCRKSGTANGVIY